MSAEAPPDFRAVLVRGTKQLTIEVRGPALYTYVHERLEGAGPPTTDAKFYAQPAVAMRNAEKLRDTRLKSGWVEDGEGTPAPDGAARTWKQATRELAARLLDPRPRTVGEFLDLWEAWSRVRVLGSGERFSAETDWGSPASAFVAPPADVKCKRLRVRRWYMDLRSGPSAIEAAVFVDDRLVKAFTVVEGPRNRVMSQTRKEVSPALDAPVLGLWMFPAPAA